MILEYNEFAPIGMNMQGSFIFNLQFGTSITFVVFT